MTLEAKGLVKSYSGRRVVDRLSMHVERGEVIGLLGPNGAGKTTTFYMMIGFIAAEEGTVLLEGEDISTLPFYRRARLGIGYLPQEPSIFTRASVGENLDLVLEWLTLQNPLLSFSQDPDYATAAGEGKIPAGDVVISLETCSRNAKARLIPEEEELKRLLIHGILHLEGLDHEDEQSEMIRLQEEILTRFKKERIF